MLRYTGIKEYEAQVAGILKETSGREDQAALAVVAEAPSSTGSHQLVFVLRALGSSRGRASLPPLVVRFDMQVFLYARQHAYLNIGGDPTMAKAKITTKSGLVMQIDGTPAEIAAVLRDLKDQEENAAAPTRTAGGRGGRVRLPDLMGALVDGKSFNKPQDLAAVRTALQELGHHYPMTTLSGAMLRQVRRRNLRRMRQDKRWVYVTR